MEQIKKISETHAEPEWMLRFREGASERAESLPTSITRGVGMTALFPEVEPTYDAFPEYHVEASKGIEIYTWKEAMTQEEITPILKGLIESPFFPGAEDRFRGNAHARFNSGLVVYVQPNMKDDGTIVEEKLTFTTSVPKGSAADMVIIVVKEGAKFDLTNIIKDGAFGSVFTRTLIVLAERDAQVRVTERGAVASGAMIMHLSRGIVAGNAKIIWRELHTGDVLVSSIQDTMLIGSGATTDVLQGLIAEGFAQFDIDASVHHLADGTQGTIKTMGIGRDQSKILYRGLIDVKEGVTKVAGAQEAKFIALTPKVRIDAIPSLDIASNDVTCTHKLSITHIKEGELFYPKIRGFSLEESRGLFLEGNFAEVFPGETNADIMMDVVRELIKPDVAGK